MFEVTTVRTEPSDDLSHEHVALVGYASPHLPNDTIFISIERVLERQAFGERFAEIVDGAPADLEPGTCPICGFEPHIKTAADTATEQKLLQLPRE